MVKAINVSLDDIVHSNLQNELLKTEISMKNCIFIISNLSQNQTIRDRIQVLNKWHTLILSYTKSWYFTAGCDFFIVFFNFIGTRTLDQRSAPSTIKSVSSMLVYDTDDIVFRSEEKTISSNQNTDMRSSNNGSSTTIPGVEQTASSELGLAEAPDSLSTSNHGGDITDGGGLMYVPELADLPEFEMLPDFLDLPNIAFDENYGTPGKL